MKIKSTRVTYEIDTESKWIIVRGDTATGKTTLVQMLDGGATEIESPDMIPVRLPRIDNRGLDVWRSNIMNSTVNTLFYADEDDIGELSLKMQGVLAESPATYLLISREVAAGIPCAVEDLKQIQKYTRGRYITNKLIPEIPVSNVNIVAGDKYNKLCTEDSKSGYNFFASYVRNVGSSEGKDKIPALIAKSVRTLYLVDACGFGSTYRKALQAIRSSPTNGLLFIDSFEALVLKSDLLQIEERPPLNCANKEKWYEHRLREEMLQLGQSYYKDNIGKCFLLNCCFHSSHCGAFARGDKFRLIVGDLYSVFEQFGIRSEQERRGFKEALLSGSSVTECMSLLAETPQLHDITTPTHFFD